MESFIRTKELVVTMSKVLNRMGGLFTDYYITHKNENYNLAIHIPFIELTEEEELLNTYRTRLTYLLVDKEGVLHPITSGLVTFSLPEYISNDEEGVSYILSLILTNNMTRTLYNEFEMEAKHFLDNLDDPGYIMNGIDDTLDKLSIDRARIGDENDG